MDRGVGIINLWWHHFIEDLECQILNVDFSGCFVKQRWLIEGKMQEVIKTVLGRLPQWGYDSKQRNSSFPLSTCYVPGTVSAKCLFNHLRKMDVSGSGYEMTS